MDILYFALTQHAGYIENCCSVQKAHMKQHPEMFPNSCALHVVLRAGKYLLSSVYSATTSIVEHDYVLTCRYFK